MGLNLDETPMKLAKLLPYTGSLPLLLYVVLIIVGICLSSTIFHYLLDETLINNIYESNAMLSGYYLNLSQTIVIP
jgi:hypothetical protein